MARGGVVVLTSFPRPRGTTNPYIVQLAQALEEQPDVELIYFSWRAALTRHFDVVHAHWPETWLEGRTRGRRAVKLLFAAMLCLRLATTRTPVVRTWHNLERPSGLGRADHAILSMLDRLTRLRIHINGQTPLPPGAEAVTILHGHYRSWFAPYERRDPVPGRIAFVGRIRPYKGVEHLLEVFRGVPDPAMTLTIAGLPSSEDLVGVIDALAAADPRVTLDLRYVDDATLVTRVSESELVVLPYRHMHNSGAVLAALSLDRPVLVPANEVNRRLMEEVGADWIHTFEGDLAGEDIQRALAQTRRAGRTSRPDLSAREWATAGAEHVKAYRLALRRERLPRTSSRLRVYESLRSAHLERARDLTPASIAYFGRKYDFDPSLAEGLDLVQLSGPRDLIHLLLRKNVRELEINEPLLLIALKHTLMAVVAARLVGLVRGHRVRVVTYAIENDQPLSSIRRRLRGPWRRAAYTLASRVVLGQVDRIAFGTSAAMENYRRLSPEPRSQGQLIPALSSRCDCVLEGAVRPPVLLFLGAFDERKGVAPLLDVWPEVAMAVPGARLVVVGQGDLEDRVRALVEAREDVEMSVAPARAEIHRRLREAKALVLWSQPSPTWREQVGLPLVEGLSHGCQVVASDETGIADWLRDHGHAVAAISDGREGLRAALVATLSSTRPADDVLADLPAEDGRLAADRWLWAP